MNVRGSNTASGAAMEVDDCVSGGTQKFTIQATVVADDTSNQTGTGGSRCTTSTFASSHTYRMVPQNATGESIDVQYGGPRTGTGVQQYANLVQRPQAFYLLENGSD